MNKEIKLNMRLNDDIFDLVKYGTKRVELRLYDEKRKQIKENDIISFSKVSDENKKIYVKVLKIDIYDSFNELINNYALEEMYFKDSSKEELTKLFNSIYSKDEQDKYKVCAIRFIIYEKSCGIAVFNDTKLLLVKHIDGHIGMPKGHMEKGETEEETAIREVKEETNIDASIVSGFRKVITYSPKPNVIKDVVFFVGISNNTDIKKQDSEISELYFIDINKAPSLITYDDDREAVVDSIKFYSSLK